MIRHPGFAAAALLVTFACAGFISADFSDCPAGTHYESSTTKCINCTAGSTFTSKRNRDKECTPCTQTCKGGKNNAAPCNVTHDTLCQCPPGHHEYGDECIAPSDLEAVNQTLNKLELKVSGLDARLNKSLDKIAAALEKSSDCQGDILRTLNSSLGRHEVAVAEMNSERDTPMTKWAFGLAIVGLFPILAFTIFWCIQEFQYKLLQRQKKSAAAIDEFPLNELKEIERDLETILSELQGLRLYIQTLTAAGYREELSSKLDPRPLLTMGSHLKDKIKHLQEEIKTTHARPVTGGRPLNALTRNGYNAGVRDVSLTELLIRRPEGSLKKNITDLKRNVLLLSAASQAVQAAREAAAASEAAAYSQQKATRHGERAVEKAEAAGKARNDASTAAADARAAGINTAKRAAAARDAHEAASRARRAAKKASAASKAAAGARAAAVSHAARVTEKAAAAKKAAEAVLEEQAVALPPDHRGAPEVNALVEAAITTEEMMRMMQNAARDAQRTAVQADEAAAAAVNESTNAKERAATAEDEAMQAADRAKEVAETTLIEPAPTAIGIAERAQPEAGQREEGQQLDHAFANMPETVQE